MKLAILAATITAIALTAPAGASTPEELRAAQLQAKVKQNPTPTCYTRTPAP